MKKLAALLIFSVFPLLSYASQQCSYNKPNELGLTTKSENCGVIINNLDCYLRWEQETITQHQKDVIREGLTLKVKLKSELILEFVSKIETGISFNAHWFIGQTKKNSFIVVQSFYYESLKYTFIDLEKGIVFTTSALPIFSPDNSHFAIANWGLETPNIVEIWKFNNGNTEKIFTYEPDWDFPLSNMWGPSNAEWSGNQILTTEKCDDNFLNIGSLTFSKQSDEWKVKISP